MATETELMQRYVGQRDERAFAELVQRHVGLVYATAHRVTGGRAHLAEEIAQKVFADLARKATSLCHHPALTGWLYRSALYAAKAVTRAEVRREKISQSLAAMPDTNAPSESSLDWQQLRPVLDEVMDQLKDRDREIMLLRFFEGLPFSEVGARLNLSENAARMRTDRALDQLRAHLARRGVTSSSAALGLLLANQAFAVAPAGLAEAVSATTLAAAPATGALLAFMATNPIALPALGVVLAGAATTLVLTTLVPGATAGEIAALREENTRLKQAASTTASAAPAPDDKAAQNSAIVEAATKRLAERTAAPGGHRNRGQATPQDTFRTVVWAADSGDIAALSKLFSLDADALATLQTVYATMPQTVRSQYRTPEEFMAFLYTAWTLIKPMPAEDVIEQKMAGMALTDFGKGRTGMRPSGETKGGVVFVQSPDGWKMEIPSKGIKTFTTQIFGNEMLTKLGLN